MIVDDAFPLAPILERRKTTLIVLWEGNKRLIDLGSAVFSVGFSNEVTGKVLARAVPKTKGLRVAIVAEESPWAEVVGDSFVAEVTANGAEIVIRESVPSNSPDLSSIVTKLRAKAPQAGSGRTPASRLPGKETASPLSTCRMNTAS